MIAHSDVHQRCTLVHRLSALYTHVVSNEMRQPDPVLACLLPPGSEIAGEAAAALASAALMYRRLGVKRSTASYITHAKQLYNLAVGAQGSYADANSRSCLGIHKVRPPLPAQNFAM
jgi:Glycosyl hydrolase family 9